MIYDTEKVVLWSERYNTFAVKCILRLKNANFTPFIQLLPTRVCFTNAGVNADGARIHKLGKNAI